MGRFERKKKSERISEILDAALKVFIEKGFRNTTMEDIISETSLSKGGFYHYFKSTDEILLTIMESESDIAYKMLCTELKDLDRDELIETIAESMVARITRENPSKKLFLMFVFEMIYKPDFLERYLKIEQETFEQMEQDASSASRVLNDNLKRIVHDERMVFFVRISGAIILFYHIFPGKKLMKKYMHYVKDMYIKILDDIITSDS